jgi:two-component system phosphate regulon sensor histidine kinase PhoR
MFPQLRPNEPLSFAIRSPDVLDALEKVLAGDASRRRVEIVEQVPVDRAFEVVISPLAGQDPEVREFVAVVLHDQTQARRLEAMRVDFVANASHELRTPLASLLGFIETLQGPARTDAAAREKFLAIMAEQARRMSRLIDDLLSLSRIEMNAHVRPRAPVDLAAVVGHIVETLAGLARERTVEIAFDPGATGAITISGERDELLRVFENLIENAIKYGQSGGRVEVGMRSRDAATEPGRREAVVSIRDFGPGIPPEHLPRLTERFYRVDAAESRHKGGTGLGLAIVKHIVNRHRGRLEIESELGHGTRVSVILPVRED